MNDSLGTDIAKTLYEHLYSGDIHMPLDPDLIAYALDEAVQNIRKKVNAKGKHPLPSMWAPFIHIGL